MRTTALLPVVLLFFLDGCPNPVPPGPGSEVTARASLVSLPGARSYEKDDFPYGVASGDPLPDRVIIWSMLDTAAARQDSLVKWQVSERADFSRPAAEGSVLTARRRHYRVKIDVAGLRPATSYFYRFEHAGRWSSVGRTRTAPAHDSEDPLKLAVVSCNAYEWGYFNAYEQLAERTDLQAVIHLGDYIYEYATGVYGDTSLGRIHQPRHEPFTEADYHRRYAQYRRDPQLRAAHEAHPFICIWDDHEIANNSYLTGAENHNADEGDYLTRVTAARHIYYDWMPVREAADGRLYRSFRFGRIADLHMLDERLAGRTAPAHGFDPADLADSTRHMLGNHQLDWLCGQLDRGTARWKLLGNQVMFARLDLTNILPEYAVNLDAWDGYRHEKNRLVDSIVTHGWENLFFLTGDTHCSWVLDLPETAARPADHAAPRRPARELAAPSVSSANYDEFVSGWDTLTVARYRLYRDNPHLQYTNLTDHGYLLLNLSAEELRAEFHFSYTIRQRSRREKPVKTFTFPYVDPHHG